MSKVWAVTSPENGSDYEVWDIEGPEALIQSEFYQSWRKTEGFKWFTVVPYKKGRTRVIDGIEFTWML